MNVENDREQNDMDADQADHFLDVPSQGIHAQLLEEIIEQTKLYSDHAVQNLQYTVTMKSRVSRWLNQEPSVPELLRFITVILVMGFTKYPSIESHWSKSWPFQNLGRRVNQVTIRCSNH